MDFLSFGEENDNEHEVPSDYTNSVWHHVGVCVATQCKDTQHY